jgi:hypothetical protein
MIGQRSAEEKYMAILCAVIGHRIDRHRVWYDGINHRTNCTRCAALMIDEDIGWRRFDKKKDFHPARKAKPERRS